MCISFLAKIKFAGVTSIQEDMSQFFCDTIGVRRFLGLPQEDVADVYQAAVRLDDVLDAQEYQRVQTCHIVLAALGLLAIADESFA
ncbi:MAG: hypothetical protein WA708_00475 [Acidobacteriaceae bacterium]